MSNEDEKVILTEEEYAAKYRFRKEPLTEEDFQFLFQGGKHALREIERIAQGYANGSYACIRDGDAQGAADCRSTAERLVEHANKVRQENNMPPFDSKQMWFIADPNNRPPSTYIGHA